MGDALLGAVSRLGGRGLASKYASTTAEILGGALVRLAVDPNATALFAEGAALR